jgi:probable F420-dependent oxidoreductase
VPATKRFRFGLQAAMPPPGTTWPDLARRVEDLGYATLTVSDHLDDQLALTPALMAAADATTELRIGSLTYCNDYRHPVVLAKDAATIDRLSGGRLELGLGAGWMTADYQQAGVALDRPGTRIERLGEALEIITGLWGDGPLSFAGRHYRIEGLEGWPKPVQAPRPPILIGGGGRRVLSLAGRWADIVGLNIALPAGRIDERAGPSSTHQATLDKVAWVREAAGPRFDQIELQVRVHLTMLSDDRRAVAEAVGPTMGVTPGEALESPYALVGTIEEIIEQCLERRERYGISYFGVGLDALEIMAPVVDRLAGT